MAKAGYGDLEVGAETTSPQAIHPQGTAAIPGITFSADTDTGVYRAGANIVGVSVGGTGQLTITDGALLPVTTNDIDLGSSGVQFKNAWFDGTLEADAITVGGVSVATGTNATTFTITAVSDDDTVYPVFVTGTSGSNAAEVDTGFTFNPSTNILTAPGEIDAASLDISGNADIDGTMEADAYTVAGDTLAEYISDTVGAMVTGNTESGIVVAYQDADNTIDFTVGTLNQNTTGSAATLTTARDIGGVSFNGSGSINLPGVNTAGNQATSGLAATATLAASATKLATARAIGGVSFDGTAAIDLPGVNTAGNQATSGLATTATTAAVATTVTITDNEDDDEDNVLVFVAGADSDGGNVGLESDGHLHYNPSTGKLTATSFAGAVTGTITGSASEIAVTAVTDNDTVHPVFVEVTSGDGAPQVATALTYNPSTGLLSAAGLTLSGNLTVSGTTTTIDTATLVVEDPLIALASGNAAADALDIGMYGLYDTSGSQDLYSGMFRDASDSGKWKLFKDLQEVPTTTVDIDGTGYAVGTLVANLEGTATTVTQAAQTAITSVGTLSALGVTGTVTAGGFAIGSAAVNEAQLEILDGASVTTTELNLIDGGTGRDTNAVATGDGILINDAGTMHMTNVDTVSTYFASHSVGGGNIVTTGALNTGSITSGFTSIDVGSGAVSGGVVTGTSLDCNGNADISGTLTMSGGTLDMSSEDVDNIRSATFIAELDHTSSMNNLEAYTVDWGLAQKQMLTLAPDSGTAVTITFVDPDGPCNLMLKVKQDGGGSNTITWHTDPAVHWAGGTAPTLSTAGGAVDLIAFYFDGLIFYGQASLAFAIAS